MRGMDGIGVERVGTWGRRMGMRRTRTGRGGVRVFWTSNLYFFIKENWICAMARHHAEPNIDILSTRNLPFDSDARQ